MLRFRAIGRFLALICASTASAGPSFANAAPDQQAVSAVTPAQTAPERPGPTEIRRREGDIVLDGALDDAGWQHAATFDRFFETSPGDNTPAKVRTQVWVTYDDRYFYFAAKADDPDPAAIRAPFVDRDKVFGTDDNIALFLDPRNDGRTAIELRVNPRGIQGDAVFNDATGTEDFSPDFFYDTAAALTSEGWNAEYRIPLSSLRYPEGSDQTPQTWRIWVWRNYPRDYRYQLHSAPIPRGSSCYVCNSHELTGFRDLPHSRHLVVAPYATASAIEDRAPESGADWGDRESDGDGGVDVKWSPTSSTAIDLTLNPDFSQVESDEAQITANERFALFFPEKRTFFLEGADLFDTPFQAVYTRSITAPDWGARVTGKFGATTYTALVAQDDGGGSVIVPFSTFSDFAPQDFQSTVAVARVRHDLGRSFAGFIAVGREVDGGGHNYVVGPDFQWRPDDATQLTGQFLWSDTENPDLPLVSPYFDGSSESAHAFKLLFSRNARNHDFFVGADDVAEGFRADTGFVTRAGYRQLRGEAGLRRYPDHPWISFVRGYAGTSLSDDRHDERLDREVYVGTNGFGRKNLQFNLQASDLEVLVGDRRLSQTNGFVFLQIDPSRRLTRVGLQATFGEAIDFANGREGDGVTWTLRLTLHPTTHLELEALWNRRTLDVRGGRLFTASVERLRGTYVFSARQLIRLIAQRTDTDRNPRLYGFPVDAESGDFATTGLYSFKLNWQTVLFVGYGDERLLSAVGDLEPTRRSVFFKISYAIQR
jgi:hypothetical protein